MAMNWSSIQNIASKLITNFGNASATLNRGGVVTRTVSCVVLQTTVVEHRGNGLLQWGDKRVLIAAKDLTVPPDNELDTLTIEGIEHKIIQPPTALQPDGTTSLYWEVFCRTVDQ